MDRGTICESFFFWGGANQRFNVSLVLIRCFAGHVSPVIYSAPVHGRSQSVGFDARTRDPRT